MHKPVVHYKPGSLSSKLAVGHPAVVFPINHTNHVPGQHVSNTKYIITSHVVHVGDHGEFETQNTIYRPENNNNKEPNNAVSQLQRDSK